MTILMYEKVFINSSTIYNVSVDRFYQQMLDLKHKDIVYLDDYEPQNTNQVVITFDRLNKSLLEYTSVILHEFNYPFEVFISSDYIGKYNSFCQSQPGCEFVNIDELKLLVQLNARLQWYSKSHSDLTKEKDISNLIVELEVPNFLKTIDPKGFKWLAYPYGNFNNTVVEEVKKRFTGAVSLEQGNNTDVFYFNRLIVNNATNFKKANIAVIITAYNQELFLVEAIESVLRQTRMPDEILISDDASNDNTYEIAKFYQNKYPDLIKLNRNDENLGIVEHFNKAVRLTTSEYISLLNGDDRYRSDFIEKTSLILDQYLDVGIAYSDFALFGPRARVTYNSNPLDRRGLIKLDKFFIINFPDFNETSKQQLLTQGNFIHGASLFKRQAFNEVGGYIYEETIPEDYYLFFRMVRQGWNAQRVAFPILEYRQYSKEQTNTRLASFATLQYYKQLSKALYLELEQLKSQFYTGNTSDAELKEYSKHLISTKISEDNIAQTYVEEFPENTEFINRVFSFVDKYKREAFTPSLIGELLSLVKQMAELWLSTEDNLLERLYLSKVGEAYQVLLDSCIQNELLTETKYEFVAEVIAQIAKGFEEAKAIQYLLVAMLHLRPHELPLLHEISVIPQWLLKDYVNYLFNSQSYFRKMEEAENYYHYIHGWINYLHSSILYNQDNHIFLNFLECFVLNANFISLYFNESNLKNIYVKRAEIIEYFLKVKNYELDCEFSDRSVTRKKIKIGILAAHFLPSSETFASLPVYEYLSRDFEVILYSLQETNHPLELYCKSCANSFRLLPKYLAEQANTIRADDLDILFIATNVTVVTNQICLLSTHRLARIQLTSGGSVVTTGMQHIDYYISGTLTDPSATGHQHYREKLVKLEGTAHCFSYGTEQGKETVEIKRNSLGIADSAIIFISGANYFKIIPELIETWAKIIVGVPNSVLVLLPFGPNWSNAYPKKAFLNHLHFMFSKHGIEAERLIVLDPQPVPDREDVKEYFKIADVYLDSYPFAGTTSLIEPLQVSLPVIARQGKCFRSAMGAAMIQALDVPDLVADSEESYIQLAIALGTDPELRQQKSAQIKKNMQGNPSFLDSRSYSAKIESLFQELFSNYLANTLSQNLRLRDVNLIIFPDWSQSEESISFELEQVIKALAIHPDSQKTTLLIDINNISGEYADLLLSAVMMNILMNEDVDVTEELEISLIDKLADTQWQALLPHLKARIVMEHENQQALAQVKAETLPCFEVESLSDTPHSFFFI